MNEDNAFLPHFIDEEIYIINEATSQKTVEKPIVTEPSPEYKKQEAEAVEAVEVAEVKEDISLTFQGNAENVLIIVNEILPEEKAFLEKVLGAVKLSINDCGLLKLSENNSSQHHRLIESSTSKVVINFGGSSLPFLQSINKYKITFVADKKVLQVDQLSAIMADVPKKKLLWECLQQLF